MRIFSFYKNKSKFYNIDFLSNNMHYFENLEFISDGIKIKKEFCQHFLDIEAFLDPNRSRMSYFYEKNEDAIFLKQITQILNKLNNSENFEVISFFLNKIDEEYKTFKHFNKLKNGTNTLSHEFSVYSKIANTARKNAKNLCQKTCDMLNIN